MDKWIKCSEGLPEEEGEYLVWCKPNKEIEGFPACVNYCEGWNCHKSYLTGEISRDHELNDVVAWQLIEPFKENE